MKSMKFSVYIMPPKMNTKKMNFRNTISDHRRGVGLIQARVYSSWSNRWLAREAGTSESVEERMDRGTGGEGRAVRIS